MWAESAVGGFSTKKRVIETTAGTTDGKPFYQNNNKSPDKLKDVTKKAVIKLHSMSSKETGTLAS